MTDSQVKNSNFDIKMIEIKYNLLNELKIIIKILLVKLKNVSIL